MNSGPGSAWRQPKQLFALLCTGQQHVTSARGPPGDQVQRRVVTRGTRGSHTLDTVHSVHTCMK